jgi:hypothetical protein
MEGYMDIKPCSEQDFPKQETMATILLVHHPESSSISLHVFGLDGPARTLANELKNIYNGTKVAPKRP